MISIRFTRALVALPIISLLAAGVAATDPSRTRPDRDGSRRFLAASAMGDDTWTPLGGSRSSELPARRIESRAVYDSKDHRTVVFGGLYNSQTFRDVWILTDGARPNWEELYPAGKPPPSRWGHSAIYDPIRNRMLVFGGNNQSESFGDLWSLSLSRVPTWTELEPGGPRPTARLGHSAIYDPVRRRMVLFGGFDGKRRNDVWTLSLGANPRWVRLATAGVPPRGRNAHVTVYDPDHDRMVVFGGIGSTDDLDDVWALSLSGTPAWTEIAPSGPWPGTRRQSAGVYDPAGRRMIVYGGQNGGSGPGYDDAWSLDLAGDGGWTELSAAAPPGRRWGHTAVYAARAGGMLVFGGDHLQDWKNDAWLLRSAGDLPPPDQRDGPRRSRSWL